MTSRMAYASVISFTKEVYSMFRKTLSTAVSFLMIGLALAGTLISCDGNAAINMAEEEKVVVSASVMDETKSLEAHVADGTENGFSAASYNNITHYKWIMKTDSPKRVYDSGYITRAEAGAGHLYANPYDNHEIVTGRYQYDFYGYVYDDIHNEYLQVAEAHATDVIVNAKTQSISITLSQLSNGQNNSANLKNLGTVIYAQMPIDFYRAFHDGSADDFELSFAGSYVDVAGVMGSAQDFGPITIEESNRAADSGKNIVKLTIADQLPTGSYKISITASLKNVPDVGDPVVIDTKTAVDILRSIERTTAVGDMNFASTTLNAMNLFADLTDKVGDHIDIEEKDGKVAFTITGQNNQDGFELTLKNPTLQQTVAAAPDKLKAVFYLNGTALEASTDYNATDNGANTTYKFTSNKFSEGINILSVTFVDERYQMSAGSATFEVTLNPDQYYVRISPVGAISCTIGDKLAFTAELVDNETGLAVATSWAWTEEAVDRGVIGIASQTEQLAKANPIFNTAGATAGKAKLKATATVGGQTYFAECEVTLN